MVIALSGLVRTDAPGRKTMVLARAVNEALSGLGLPVSRYTFGQIPESLHEGINYALSTARVVVTPTGDPWRVSATMFERMIDLVFQKLRELDPAYAGTISREEVAAAIVERGYMSSAPPPVYTQPALPTAPTVTVEPDRITGTRLMALQYAVTEVLTNAPDLEAFPGQRLQISPERYNAVIVDILQTANQPGWATNPGYVWTPAFVEEEALRALQGRGYTQTLTAPVVPVMPTMVVSPVDYTPAIRTVVIDPPYPGWTPAPLPDYSPTETTITGEEPDDKNLILWVVGAAVGGLLLSNAMKQRGGRYA